jgi:hypothetical protein
MCVLLTRKRNRIVLPLLIVNCRLIAFVGYKLVTMKRRGNWYAENPTALQKGTTDFPISRLKVRVRRYRKSMYLEQLVRLWDFASNGHPIV